MLNQKCKKGEIKKLEVFSVLSLDINYYIAEKLTKWICHEWYA